MAKCFITGVDLPVEESYILDLAAAYRALKNLRHRVASVERLIQQLSPHDDTEVYDIRKRETINRKDRRLVSQPIAEALSAVYPEEKLFITWSEWRSRRLTSRYISAVDDQLGNRGTGKESDADEIVSEESTEEKRDEPDS